MVRPGPHLFLIQFAVTPLMIMAQADGIYVSDAGNFNAPPWQIVHYDQAGQNPSPFITTELNWPQDILFLEDSNVVLISNLGSGTINRHDATTGDYLGPFATGLLGPTRMKVGPDGLLYVLQWQGEGIVRRYALDGSSLGEFTSVGVTQSIGLDWDGSGDLYVSSYNADLVRRFDPQGNDLGVFIDSHLIGPTNIWFDTNGDLLVADYDGASVKRFDSSGNYLGVFINGLMNTEGVDHYPDGRFLLGDGGTSSVKLFEADGTFVQDFVPSGSGGLMTPNAVVIRGQLTLGTTEHVDTVPAELFLPNVGRIFTLQDGLLERIRRMHIHNSVGKLVDRSIHPLWSAEALPAGTYLVVVEWKNGGLATQQLQVMDRP